MNTCHTKNNAKYLAFSHHWSDVSLKINLVHNLYLLDAQVCCYDLGPCTEAKLTEVGSVSRQFTAKDKTDESIL
jgi:hypothetical protein